MTNQPFVKAFIAAAEDLMPAMESFNFSNANDITKTKTHIPNVIPILRRQKKKTKQFETVCKQMFDT